MLTNYIHSKLVMHLSYIAGGPKFFPNRLERNLSALIMRCNIIKTGEIMFLRQIGSFRC